MLSAAGAKEVQVIRNHGNAAGVCHRGTWRQWPGGRIHEQLTGKESAAILIIISVGNGKVARAVRAAILGESARTTLADLFMGASNQPATLQKVRSVIVGIVKVKVRTQAQRIQRHKSAVLIHI